MATEFAGLALGVTSLLVPFKGALDGYASLLRLWDSFSNSSFYSLKLRIERDRLRAWGDLYGLNAVAQTPSRFEAESEHTRRLIADALSEIKAATMDVEKLASRYGLQPAGPDAAPGAETQLPTYETIRRRAEEQKDANSKLSKSKRCTISGMLWVLRDEERLGALLQRLVYLNDSLEKLCPKDDILLLALGLSSYILPSVKQPANLSSIEESSKELLACCAMMKRLQIISDVSYVETVSHKSLININNITNGAARQTATLLRPDGNFNVLVEWKDIAGGLTCGQRTEAIARFSLLSCVGLVNDMPVLDSGHDQRFGIVFAFPALDIRMPLMLSQLISDPAYAAPLGDRLALAQTLALAVLLVHSARWLHKSLQGNNIVFFPQRLSGRMHPGSPFVACFDYARPQQAEPIDRPKQVAGYVDVYRNPEWNAGFTRLCDTYSLGVLLFEIAILEAT
ncbi:hypothetical protein N657DRAFT_691854 [Parathielavia appendiculata]|uniref:Protein kinase domain-containing protein n=1 Tax=Parathielavia appendiculata TaxID=2587402 RepID=A0AAN6TXY8_9PEZI|nr:hypothetical protein N657DRAFT_691854 [Parathielavia appendiculata]